jgi:hypothetical protein
MKLILHSKYKTLYQVMREKIHGSIMVRLAVLIFVSIAIIMIVPVQTAASTSISSLDPTIVTPPPTPTPSITIPNTQLDIDTLFKTLMTQDLSSVDQVVLTTELERILDELAGGQYQVSAEFEDRGEESEGATTGTETEKILTITISPIGVPEATTEEEQQEDNGGDDDGGDDDGGDD